MGKKKGAKGKKGKKVVDGISTSEMSRDQLLGHTRRLQAEIEREREERNFFMLEREKLFSLWNMVLEQLSLEKDKGRHLHIKLDEVEQLKLEEMALQKEKIRFLMLEQNKKLGLGRLGYLLKVKKVQDDLWTLQEDLKKNVGEKKRELRSFQSSLHDLVRNIQKDHIEEISTLRKEFSTEIRRIQMDAERQIMQEREETNIESKTELVQLANEKNRHFEQLIKLHEKQLLELQGFFKDITVNNLAMIACLQDQIETQREKEQSLQASLSRYMEMNQNLTNSLRNYDTNHESKLEEHEKIKKKNVILEKHLRNTEIQLERKNKEYILLECGMEALFQKHKLLESEANELRKFSSNGILEFQRKSVMRELMEKQMMNKF